MLLVIDPDLRIDPGVEVRRDLVKFEIAWSLIPFDWRAFSKSVRLPEKGLSSRLSAVFIDLFSLSVESSDPADFKSATRDPL